MLSEHLEKAANQHNQALIDHISYLTTRVAYLEEANAKREQAERERAERERPEREHAERERAERERADRGKHREWRLAMRKVDSTSIPELVEICNRYLIVPRNASNALLLAMAKPSYSTKQPGQMLASLKESGFVVGDL